VSEFPPVTHLAVTVSDLSVSVPWYEKLFGSAPVDDHDFGPFRHVVFALPDGFVYSLHQFSAVHAVPGAADERRAGIDHFAFRVENREALERWAGRLDELGIEHGEILDAYYGSGLAFRDPDNIQLEFFAPLA
jgi:glyoxylase I family protein